MYYSRATDPTMLMALNSLEQVQINPTTETTKYITQFLNYSTSHPYSVTEYRRSRMILHIYLDASYISEPEARIRAGGYFYRTKIQHTNTRNAPVKCSSTLPIWKISARRSNTSAVEPRIGSSQNHPEKLFKLTSYCN